MKKQIFTILNIAGIFFNSFSQSPSWTAQMGGANPDIPMAIVADPQGNVYTTGVFRSTADFDPGPGTFSLSTPSSIKNEVFISKLDAAGNFVWAKSLGANETDEGWSISVDNSGNVIVSGSFSDTVDFDPGPSVYNMSGPAGGYDCFILKLDANGNFIWAKQLGFVSYGCNVITKTDVSGNVIAAGVYKTTIDFDWGPGTYNMTPSSSSNAFVLKVDPNGNYIWSESIGGTATVAGYGLSITTDNSSNITIACEYSGSGDFDPSAATNIVASGSGSNICILKLDSTGIPLWIREIGSNNNMLVWSVCSDNTGNLFTTGRFTDTTDFDPSGGVFNVYPTGAANTFVLKLDTGGNFIWAISYEANFTWSITTDAANNVLLAGSFGLTADFDPGSAVYNLTSTGPCDGYFLQLGPSGNFLSLIHVNGSGYDEGTAITGNANGYAYAAGNFTDTTDFDFGPGVNNYTSAGGHDIFIINLSQTTGLGELITNGFEVFPNPASSTLTIRTRDEQNILGVRFYDLNGKQVMHTGNTQSINISCLSGGIYFVRCEFEGYALTQKILIR